MPSTFEVFFVASVPALGVSHYTLMYGSEGSATAVVQYINHQLSRYVMFIIDVDAKGFTIIIQTSMSMSPGWHSSIARMKQIADVHWTKMNTNIQIYGMAGNF